MQGQVLAWCSPSVRYSLQDVFVTKNNTNFFYFFFFFLKLLFNKLHQFALPVFIHNFLPLPVCKALFPSALCFVSSVDYGAFIAPLATTFLYKPTEVSLFCFFAMDVPRYLGENWLSLLFNPFTGKLVVYRVISSVMCFILFLFLLFLFNFIFTLFLFLCLDIFFYFGRFSIGWEVNFH